MTQARMREGAQNVQALLQPEVIKELSKVLSMLLSFNVILLCHTTYLSFNVILLLHICLLITLWLSKVLRINTRVCSASGSIYLHQVCIGVFSMYMQYKCVYYCDTASGSIYLHQVGHC
jgi:hypothetical protein